VDAACDAVVRTAVTIGPRPEAAAVLDRRYAVFRRVYPALRAFQEVGR
jgi:hypothetical protein